MKGHLARDDCVRTLGQKMDVLTITRRVTLADG